MNRRIYRLFTSIKKKNSNTFRVLKFKQNKKHFKVKSNHMFGKMNGEEKKQNKNTFIHYMNNSG